MKVFVAGVAAAFLGFLGVIIWRDAVFRFIKGTIPLILLLGGLMAAFVGYDEVEERLSFKKGGETEEPASDTRLREESEKFKQEVERLKSELDKTRPSQTTEHRSIHPFIKSEETSQFPKERVNLMMLGHVDHGKTALTSAITKVLSRSGQAKYVPFDELDRAREENFQGVQIAHALVEFKTENHRYALHDFPGHADIIKCLLMGAMRPDIAILVVAADDGPMPQTGEHILLARQVGVPYIVVFLNKVDMVDDPELIKLVELEVRELLSKYGFPGDDVPIIRGSALKAIEADSPDSGDTKCVFELMNAIDSFVSELVQDVDKPFLMPIEDVFSISGKGTVVTGRVERGTIKVGDDVEIVGSRPTTKTVCTGVEMFRNVVDSGRAGDNIEVLLRGTNRDEVKPGQLLAKPGTITPHTRFKAEVYILKEEEGGRHTPLFSDYRSQFYFRKTDVTGVITLPEGVEMVMPGDNTSMEVKLNESVAIEKGLHAVVGEVNHMVGAGVVSEIIE